MASVVKQGQNWTIRYRNRGERNPRRYTPPAGTGRREAEELARQIQLAIDTTGSWSPSLAPPTTLDDLVEVYLDFRAQGDSATRPAKATTLRAYDVVVRRLFVPHARGGAKTASLHALTRAGVKAFLDARRQGGASERTIVQYRSLVGSLWKWAHERHPDHVAPPSLPPVLAPEAMEVLAPDWEQIDRMIAGLSAGSEVLRRVVILQRYTGLRISQAGRLQWGDLAADWEGRGPSVHIRRELGKSRQEAELNRHMPIHPELWRMLQSWRLRDGRPAVGRLVTGGPLPGSARDTLRAAWERAEVPPDRWFGHPSHALRRRFITHLEVVVKARERVIDYLVGHARRDVKGRSYIVALELWEEMRQALSGIPTMQEGVPQEREAL